MALVPCPECQREVSTHALACPQCAFPFPGKRGLSESSASDKLSPCPDCGFLVSKHARACPHCGVPQQVETGSEATNGNLSEETWLCPHCGTPYTRKVKLQGQDISHTPEASTILPVGDSEDKELPTPDFIQEFETKPPDLENLLPLRSRSPLWQDPSAKKETSYPRYPRSRKKTLIVGLIIFVIVAVAIALGALWQFEGINPLQAFVN